MPFSQKMVDGQLARLQKNLKFPRDTDESNREIRKALRSACSEVSMVAAVNELVETTCDFPTPSEIYAMIRKHEEHIRSQIRPDELCQICNGSGWRIITRGGLSGADPCMCVQDARRRIYV